MKNKNSPKIIATLLSFVLLFSSIGIPVFATDTGMTRPEDAAVEDSVEENLELGEEQVEEMPLTQVMSQKETQLPEVKPKSIDEQKDWKAYDLASPSIETLQIQERISNESDVTIGLSGTVEFNLPIVLKGNAATLWIGYKFILPQRSPSGGAYSFEVGSYSWLQPLDDKGAITVKQENGNWILEGKVLAQNANGNPIAPGLFSSSLKVKYSGLVNNETVELKGDCWIINSDALPVSAKATMTSKGESKYYADNWSNGIAISGYFNNSTGDFSLRKPKNPDGYVYGRVYTGRQLIWHTSGTERLDPTKPLEFDFEYKLYKTENGVESEVTDPEKMPILMAMKRSDGTLKENQLEGSKVNDFTLGNLIADTSGYNGQYNEGFYRGGDYTFKQTTSNVHVSAVLSKDNKNSGYKQVVTYCLIFVPVTEDASEEDMKKPPYSLKTEVKNVKGTSYSNQNIIVECEQNKTKKTVNIYNKATEEKLPLGGKMSRTTYIANDIHTGKKGAKQETRANIKVDEVTKGYIRDYNIHSINMLIKFEDGLTLDKISNTSGKNYTGDVKFLYATKKDGEPWSSEVEMNHTQDYQLVYYDKLEVAKEHGHVVAVLAEFRNGLWATGASLSVYPYFILTGESGSSQAFVQDVKVWRGEDVDIKSWAETNGTPVEEEIRPYDDFMVPYDNPKNNDVELNKRVYRKNIWPEGKAEPQSVDDSMYGWTIFIIGGSVNSLPYNNKDNPSINLNGTNQTSSHGPFSQKWSSSTFDTSLGYRVVDRVYTFEVKDIGEKELSFSVTLDKPSYYGTNSYMSRIGKVYLSTKDNPVTYIPNENVSKQGTFKGGIEIDPENFTVPGEGIYRIYYSSYLGSETDLSKDIPNAQHWSCAAVNAIGNTPRYVKKENTRIDYSTIVVKTASTSISKESISEGTKTKAEYNLMIQEHKQTADNTFIMDILPYNGDDAGSSFHGSYKIDQNKIDVTYQSTKGDAKSKMKIFYTTDKKIREIKDGKRVEADIFSGLKVTDLRPNFEAGGVIWQEASVEADSTSFKIPNEVTPTAIVLAGNVEQDERVTAKISLVLDGQKVGDKYNNLSSTQLETLTESIPSEIASVTVIGRNVAGTAWQDKNKNGIFDEGDVTFEGVKAHLYKADNTEITHDANNKSYGEVITGKDGSYKFEDVPENQDGYYVEFEGTDKVSIDDYQTVEQYKSGAKSPFEKNDDSDVIFQDDFVAKVKTETFKLKSDKNLMTTGDVQNADGINAGFEKALAMKAEKTWNGKANSEKGVGIQLQRRASADAPWEKVKDATLSESSSWKTTFDKQPVLYNGNGVARYEYRVVELDVKNKPVENGTIITLNGNDYHVKADKLSDDSWKITNNRIVDLTIENEVLGELGDRTKEFLIVISARDSGGNPISGTFDCEGLDGVDAIEFREGVANVQLAHDEKIVIKKVAHSTSFGISVDAASGQGYTVKYKLDQGAESDNASFSITGNSVVKVLNTKTDIPDTGISNDSNDKGILIVLGVLGIAMLGLPVLRKRKGLR